MQTFLRALRLYAMVAWVGGLLFFAFVVAPVAFGSLPSTHEAGIVVGGTLRVLHWIGLIGGGVFCLATGWLWLWAEVPARIGFARQLVLTGLMLAVTKGMFTGILMGTSTGAATGSSSSPSLSTPSVTLCSMPGITLGVTP